MEGAEPRSNEPDRVPMIGRVALRTFMQKYPLICQEGASEFAASNNPGSGVALKKRSHDEVPPSFSRVRYARTDQSV